MREEKKASRSPVCLSTLPIDELAVDVETERDLRDTLVSGGIEVVGVDGGHYDAKREREMRRRSEGDGDGLNCGVY